MKKHPVLDSTLTVICINAKTFVERLQRFKCRNLINKRCLFTDSDGARQIGQVLGFTESGEIVVVQKDGKVPMNGTEVKYII